MTAVLRATGLSVSYGGVRALSEVDLEVREGQLVGLIGPNGAGKTTFIDAVTGFAHPSGTVELDGRDLTHLPPASRARLGLARTWQAADLFDDLTVAENLAVTAERPSLLRLVRGLASTRNERSRAVEATLRLFDLELLANAMPDQLTQGQRKLVGVARALASEPRVVCLDEPAAGLDTRESAQLGQRLRRIVETGAAMLLVDHDMGLVLSVCDWVVVLDFGKVIARGAPEKVRAEPRVIEAYLGRAAARVAGEERVTR